jgi:2-polyprenyl-3-methyl-5-hydroxy-6-metoxy-1,4-benzoquinol methylase
LIEMISTTNQEAKRWAALEIEYGRRLRASTREQRKSLYAEAYSEVSKARMETVVSTDPEKRTAGTSRELVAILARICHRQQRVLEVGCGRGYTCWQLAPHVKEIIGTDVSEPSLAEARDLLSAHSVNNASVMAATADTLTDHFAPESFDTVLSIEVFEHLHPEDGEQHLREVYALLKPGGSYVVFTPNRLTGPTDATRDIFPNAVETMGFHLNETTNGDLIAQMQKIGFGRFRSVVPLAWRMPIFSRLWYPAQWCVWAEELHPTLKQTGLGRFSEPLLGIMIRGFKIS